MPETRKKTVKILIVDDHPLVRLGLAALIGDEHDLAVCGEAEDEAEALRLVEKLRPDLVIVDLTLKSGHGIELIKRILAIDAHAKILVSSMHDEGLFAERAIRAGAMGYINKGEAQGKIILALRQIIDGRHYLSAQMHERILRRLSRSGRTLQHAPIETLSDRELAVFEQIGHGRTTREAAEALHIGIKTVETYCQNIKTKLGLKNYAELRSSAVKWVLENG